MRMIVRLIVLCLACVIAPVGDVDAPVVLEGLPKSRLDAYVGKLVRVGHAVAIAVQDYLKDARRLAEVIRLNSRGMVD